MNLKLLKGIYQVIKLEPNDPLPNDIINSAFYSLTKTDEEISIVTNNELNIASKNIEKDWKAIKIVGILDFSLIGILSKISKLLADNEISIFVISTYNTDYILVKEKNIDKTIKILSENDYHLEME